MVGHGGPHIATRANSNSPAPTRARFLPGGFVALVLCLAAVFCCAPPAWAQSADLVVRLTWGGGTARQWRTSLRLSEGRFIAMQRLSLEADSPGSAVFTPAAIHISQLSPRAYDGLDLRVDAPLHANLIIDFSAENQPATTRQLTVPVRDLLDSFSEELDEQNNRLVIRRAPGDLLRMQFQRESLVFAPGELFQLEVVPHWTGITEAKLRCNLKLRAVENPDVALWNDSREITLQEGGSASPAGPFQVTMPAEEGVYEIVASLNQRRLTGAFAPKVHLERVLQFVVIDSRAAAPAADQAAWEQIDEIDPSKPNWRQRLPSLPKWKVLPAFDQGTLSDKAELVTQNGQTIVRLDPGGWQAYPLPTARIGKPHLLSVEYPADIGQTLGISIIEPNAAGQVVPIGLDSGVYMPGPATAGETNLRTHTIVFWPRTKNPLVLLTNRRDSEPAAFSRIRIMAGPDQLQPAAFAKPDGAERLLAAYFDKPLFPENFCAPEGLDAVTGRSLDDWTTFYEGGRRLAEYLKHAGYNGAVVSVLCEGSSIYPSNLLEPTPKYDMGVFFASGQDARRKDVLEMLLRIFDREGLKLVPAFQFAAPLPELELQLVRGGSEIEGIRLVDLQGLTWSQRHGTRRGLAPYYNPLDPRVQSAMRRVVGEVTQRYSQHAAFGGIALQMSPHGYVQLPDKRWGYDGRTIARFEQELQVQVPNANGNGLAERIIYLQTDGAPIWQQWRATQLAQFYGTIQQDLLSQRRDARLFLAGAELLTSRPVQEALRPSLPERAPIGEALLQLGIAPQLLADYPQIVLLQSQRVGPLVSLPAQAADVEWRTAPEVERFFADNSITGQLFYHEPLPLRLPAFDAVSPFGPENTETWIIAQLSPWSYYSRQRIVHSLATADANVLMDGGWMIPLGQEDELRNVLELYRRLPVGKFRKVELTRADGSMQPVTVRTLSRGDQTFIYMVNDSPWPVSISLELKVPPGTRIASLTSRPVPSLVTQEGRSQWNVTLPPYEVAGGVLGSPNAKVEMCRVHVDEAVKQNLMDQIHGVKARITALDKHVPLPVLENPGFEQAESGDSPTGWTHARGQGIKISVDSQQPHSGSRSLRMQSSGPVAWVRSAPFAPPTTGRLSIYVWLRVANKEQQPPLRLAVEGTLDGQPYKNSVSVGQGKDTSPIEPGWGVQGYLAQLDNLPLTGLSDLRIAFDMMGPGEVWIDDVEVHDLWFLPNEQNELTKRAAVAQFQLEEGNLSDCLRYLEGYWPRFLMRYVPLDTLLVSEAPAAQSATAAPPVASNAASSAPAEAKEAVSADASGEKQDRSRWGRLRSVLPKWPF